MDLFLFEGGSCSYDNESSQETEFPSMYMHYLKNWEPNPLPKINIDFTFDGRTYQIAPSTLHGLGLFTIDGVNIPYNS